MNKLPEDPIKYLRLADFSGGRNTTITPALLNANESPTAKRMSFDQKGTIRPGWGRVKRYSTPFSTQPVSGLGEYRKNDGRTWLMIGAGDKIYYDRPSMTWKWEGDALPDDMLQPLDDPTFTRSSIAYKQDGTQVAANVPRFEDGKFGKAVLVEEGTENLLTNPSFETGDFSDWFSSFQSGLSYWSVASGDKYHGEYCAVLAGTGVHAWRAIGAKVNNPTVGSTYTFSAYIKCDSGITHGAYMGVLKSTDNGATWDRVYTSPAITSTNWSRVEKEYTVETGVNAIAIELRSSTGNAVGKKVYADACQIEKKPYATSFTDSTRSHETLTIPTAGVLNPQEGTIEFRWCPINQPASTMTGSQTVAPPIIQVGNYYQNNSWLLWCGISSQLELLVRGDNATGWTGRRLVELDED